MRCIANRRTVGSMLLAAALASSLRAQDTAGVTLRPTYRARVLGVFDEASGEPLAGVRVLDVLNGNFAQTTKTGTVSLAFLPDGGSLVRLQKIGFATQTLTVKISAADTAPLTIMMSRVTELPKVVTRDSTPTYISPNLRGFQEREKTENGYFVDEATLRKNENRTLANLLETKPGITLYRAPAGTGVFLLRSPRCMNGGPPQVFLDGVLLSPPPATPGSVVPRQKTTVFGSVAVGASDANSEQAFDISSYNISDLAGVEWYPDGTVMPVGFFKGNNRCGALMLWTRER